MTTTRDKRLQVLVIAWCVLVAAIVAVLFGVVSMPVWWTVGAAAVATALAARLAWLYRP